ncbi:MAG TPA: hypothetical protein VFR85_20610 [Anaeromyxobacteraceae bacterium]|nr:hypothetical protein [Anaeromyxobacteraceae bacterium]
MAPPAAGRATLGIRPHTGWAAVVALSGTEAAPRVVAKHRVEMAATFEVGAVYHVAQDLPLARAEALIRWSEQAFIAAARASLAALAAGLRDLGLEPVSSAILAGGGRPLPPLEAILRSHPLVHAAEGELYRRALARACDECAIPARFVPASDLAAQVARAAGVPEKRVVSVLGEIGKASGKPWTRDQKEAALAAWLALAGRG